MERMWKNMTAALVIVLNVLHFAPIKAQDMPWQDTTLALDERVEWLVGNLTLEEKLSLMVHQNPAIDRVGLPAYSWWNEALHGVARAGYATVYPMPIALAATFDPGLVRHVFGEVALEARRKYHEAVDTGGAGADYTGLTFFTPNINIFRDPRWGRGMETYGEDPFLTAQMGLACVEGLQHGGSSEFGMYTAACLKHLAVHSGPEGVRHEFDSRVDARDLRTTYLPAFEYIIKNSDVRQVMCGYNRLNGEPCCTNRELLVDILRNEWHYDGMVVTDCWALNDAYELDTVIPRHRTHPSAALAYGDAFGSEVDLECGSGLAALRQAVRNGYVSEAKVDDHVRRLLRVRLEVTDGPRSTDDDICEHPALFAPAANTIVMLKNDSVLPIAKHTRVYLCGPNAEDTIMPLGNYNGTPRHTWSISTGMGLFYDLVATPEEADLVVYAGGLSPQLEGEELPVDTPGFYRGDRTLIELPASQVADLHRLHAIGKPVVLVLCTGSAIALEGVVDDVDAILVAWYGGEDMGGAVALQMLRGVPHTFGRLPVTFYRSTSQLPPFEDYGMRGRTYRYLQPGEALFPFGYGLTYINHHIEGVAFDPDGLVVRAVVAADGGEDKFATRAVVQVYVSSEFGVRSSEVLPPQTDTSELRVPNSELSELPRLSLVGIGHCYVGEGDSRTVEIKIDPFWLRQYSEQTLRLEEPADGTPFTLHVGLSSGDLRMIEIPFVYRHTK